MKIKEFLGYLGWGILIMVGVFAYISSISPVPEGYESPEAMPICNIPQNQTISVFFYPAKDYNSLEPKFFENTEYEIFRNGEYFGKFEGNRFNLTYLNLTHGDYLNMLISAKDKDCYVSKRKIDYEVKCEPVQYIIPELHCLKKTDVTLNKEWEDVLNKDVIVYSDEFYLDLDIYDIGNYELIECGFDRKYIDGFDVYSNEEYYDNQHSPQCMPILLDYTYRSEAFRLKSTGDYKDRYTMKWYVDEMIDKPFTSTVLCRIYDIEWFIQNYEIFKDSFDRQCYNKGQEDIVFNFTIQFMG